MRQLRWTVAIAAVSAGLLAGSCGSDDDSSGEPATTAPSDEASTADSSADLVLSSPAFVDGGPIPAAYTCDGENLQPGFDIEGVPDDAVDLVLIVDDPDAPDGSFIHWLIWGIDPDGGIAEGAPPAGAVEGTTGVGSTGWFGPCPPPGSPHGYEFAVAAVSEPVDLPAGATVDELRAAIAETTIDDALLIGTYERT